MKSIYPWQDEQWQYLHGRVINNSLPHAILLAGQAGMGKRHFAMCFAKALLCITPTANAEACQQCKSCLLFAANNHPDFSLIESEAAGKPIKIDQIRTLIQTLLATTQLAKYKLAIIHQAEAMNTAAANALLKTLEEPEGQSLIILTTHSPSLLSATIRSRCQLVNFLPALNDTARQWLAKQLPNQAAEEFLWLSEGAPLAALILQEGMVKRNEILNHLLGLARQEFNPITLAASYQKTELTELLTGLMSLISDIIKLNLTQNSQYIFNKTYLSELQKLVKSTTLAKLYDYLDELIIVRQQGLAGVNFNQQLLLERILYQWQNCFI
ncbi:MAG: hypothetical protein K0S11_1134 [Gammaproteobacteria bacterium]|jgi:DNA polymerase-3 subunit delta'|nr:hypothetical protein [Gammaproteobacteria bacterium]